VLEVEAGNLLGKIWFTAHTGMNISRGEFTHVIDDILGVLEKKQIDEESKKDLAILLKLHRSLPIMLYV
jgi:hemoglobin